MKSYQIKRNHSQPLIIPPIILLKIALLELSITSHDGSFTIRRPELHGWTTIS